RMWGFLSAASAELAARSETPSSRALSQSGRSAEAFILSPRSRRCGAARFTHAVCRISRGGGPPLLKRVMVGEKQKRQTPGRRIALHGEAMVHRSDPPRGHYRLARFSESRTTQGSARGAPAHVPMVRTARKRARPLIICW